MPLKPNSSPLLITGSFCAFFIVVVSVSFNQSTYSVSEGDGSVEFRLALSSPLGCNCYAQVVVTTDDVTAESKHFTTHNG